MIFVIQETKIILFSNVLNFYHEIYIKIVCVNYKFCISKFLLYKRLSLNFLAFL
jgi:hypothetical protein